ncbi:hypothetical protein G7K_2935-t1 [Saitoella complicata NRRL Y-17804]|uniref:Tr-type G domain-containing protein n=2 Tax=Saitoella complicata (strain BCRC 22490 / CBS 7301 / JCM 7358 / NBRC 10748 / NRRL Y-17804) TaxID=698492 RepID=A0A0E9NGD3_SAICN|nr:hypothetical protein G7K_2935-t1 [Saitoella complicata NRRL Y-17804]
MLRTRSVNVARLAARQESVLSRSTVVGSVRAPAQPSALRSPLNVPSTRSFSAVRRLQTLGAGVAYRAFSSTAAVRDDAVSLEDPSTFPAEKIRNIAIIAHVDHGKTTLVDQLLKQSGTLSSSQLTGRVMDSNDLERERGITILSKVTSIVYKGHKINIVDTPGHADFGGEVERVLGMVDGVILVVDATEGVMTQTKFVVRKALAAGLRPVVVMNKADRPSARIDQVDSDLMDLFMSLEASDEQLDYPTLLASAKEGWSVPFTAGLDGPKANGMTDLFEQILESVPAPVVDRDAPFSMLVTQTDRDEFVGKLYLGKVKSGVVRAGSNIKGLDEEGKEIDVGRVTKVFSRVGLNRITVNEAAAGDIVSIAGIQKATVNSTICDLAVSEVIPSTPLDPPTISMIISPNDSPLLGTEGTQLTASLLKDRLETEAQTNVALKLHSAHDGIDVRGRGVLHLGILLETLRREGFELSVSPPTALFKRGPENTLLEPVEEVTVDVDSGDAGTVIEKLNKRKGEMKDYVEGDDGKVRLVMEVPARGLLGYVGGEFKNDTHGTGVLNHTFHSYQPFKGEIATTRKGSIISMSAGVATSYALDILQPRGILFVTPGQKIYAGQIVGEHSKSDDIEVNPVKQKQLTNMRAAGKDDAMVLSPPRIMTLEEAVAYVRTDECIEVTPKSIRMRKKILDAGQRKQAGRRKDKGMTILD